MYAVILAGGSGTRLWPLARAASPKPFLPLIGGKSLFRRTLERILPLVGRRRVLVVAGSAHAVWVRREAPEIPRANLLLEEIGRNTAASVALAALWIRRRHEDGLMIVLPADHWIAPASAFRATLRRGIRAVRKTGGLLTIGVPVRSPETGFGYILPAPELAAPGVARVASFVEKPTAARVRTMAASRRWLWNSGIFVWKASTILDELERHAPRLWHATRAWSLLKRRGAPWRISAKIMRRIPEQPIDSAVLERSRRVLVARAGFRWSDAGNWTAVAERLTRDQEGNAGLGALLAIEASRCAAFNPGGLSVFVGVHDLVAVRSGEIILVCHRRAAQAVRRAVHRLRGPLARYR